MGYSTKGAFNNFFEIITFEKDEIKSIYFYSILSGLVQLSLPLGIQSIISFVLAGSISTSLVVLIVFVLIGVFINGLLQVNQMKIIEKIEQQLFVRYSFRYANTIPHLNLREIDKYYLPEMVNRFFDTITLQKGISKLLLEVPTATIQILFGLILLSFYHPLFIVFGLIVITILFFTLKSIWQRGMETSIQESNFKYKVAGYLEELARVVTTLKFSNNKSLHLKKTDEYVSGYLGARTQHFNILLFQYWLLIIFKVIIAAAMLIFGSFLLIEQQINIGQFIAAEIVILMVIGSVEKLIVNLDKIYDVFTSVEKLTLLIDKPIEKSGNVILPLKNEGISIQIKNFNFSFINNDYVLKNINLDIKKGEKICIQGPFSSGKSTLLKVLSGTFENFEGNFNFDEIPICDYDIQTIRSKSGVMLNIIEIFQGTIKENITLNNEDISFQHIDELSKIVGLKDYVDLNREGYNMQLQPTGQHLSAKIKKKISLVRALLDHPRLLLLEEPWLGLEENYAASIKDYLLNKTPHTTVIVATNDAEFAAQCDKVIHLQNGEIKFITTKDNARR
jgi:ABC-type bacteriocin/lantibiotic exporter with double-glycine peptidase domain